MGEVNDYDLHQQRLCERTWSWSDMPFYDGPGTRPDVARFHELAYLDVYERVYGRKIGANGIGRLREVALVRPTGFENRPWEDGSAAGLELQGIAPFPDPDRFADELEGYAATLEQEGVTVHWIDPRDDAGHVPAPPLACAAGDLLIVRGGAIVGRSDWNPLAAGRREWLAAWVFWNLNIPTLLTVSGRGVADAGATLWLDDDVFVTGLSLAYDEDGLEQLLDTVRLSSGPGELEVLTIRCQGNRWFDRQIGAAAHVTNLLAPLADKLALCHPAGIDTSSLLWLRRRGYRLLEADPDDQVRYAVCNIVLLEPGRVIMPAGADKTIERVRAAGVEVLEVPASSVTATGTGLRATTMEIYREPYRNGDSA